jgi:peptide/nickel transport system substrate-binding protein
MPSLEVLRLPRTFGRKLLVAAVALLTTAVAAATAAPSGRAVMAFHVTISPSWFDPSAAPPQITPFGVLYAIHDALVDRL